MKKANMALFKRKIRDFKNLFVCEKINSTSKYDLLVLMGVVVVIVEILIIKIVKTKTINKSINDKKKRDEINKNIN